MTFRTLRSNRPSSDIAIRLLLVAMLAALAALTPAQLAGSGWAKIHGDITNSGRGTGANATSTPQWVFSDNINFSAPVVGTNGIVYFSTGPTTNGLGVGSLYAVDATTGKVIWSHLHLGMTLSVPAVGEDGTVYLEEGAYGENGAYLLAFDGDDGSFKWLQYLPSGTSPTIGPDNTVYSGVSAVDGATGMLKWTSNISIGGPLSTMAVSPDGKMLYGGNFSTDAFALDAATGSLVWSYQTKGQVSPSPVVGPNGNSYNVYFGSFDGNLYALDSVTGKLVWSFQTGNAIRDSPTVGNDGTVYMFGNLNGNQCVYAIDPANGNLKWTAQSVATNGVSATLSSPSLASDGTLYYIDPLALVVNAIDTSHSGKLLWSYPIPGVGFAFDSTPAIGPDGSLYIASSENVTALESIHVIDVTLKPSTVLGGASSIGTVTLNLPAPPNGLVVTLGSNRLAASVPGSITVPSGATTATFTVTTTSVNAVTVANIGATPGVNRTASLTINPIEVSSVSFNPSTVVGGKNSTGTVTLDAPAGNGGLTVALASASNAVSLPSSVTVLAGQTTATFTVATIGVDASTQAAVIASLNGQSSSGTLTVNPAGLSGLSMSPTTVMGGTSSTGTVTLSGPAGPSGTALSLASNSSSASTPTTVTIAAGQTSAAFAVSTIGVDSPTTATITATLGAVSMTATLAITPAKLSSLTLSPTSVLGGSPSTGTVTLTGPAGPSGSTVVLSSSISAANVPSSLILQSGQSSATFAISTTGVNNQTAAMIKATFASISQTATLTISAAKALSLTMNPSTVVGGISTTGTLSLTGPAGPSGDIVSLSSSSPSVSVPGTVTVAAGQTTGTFIASTVGVPSQISATITATLSGSVTASLTVQPPTVASVSLSPPSVVAGNSSQVTVTLSSPAGPAGIGISLSSDQADATVPASVTILAGQTSATCTVSTGNVGAPTPCRITAKLNGQSQSALLTITPITIASLSLSPSTVIGGKSSTGTVTLNSPATNGGLTVSLSSNSTSATVPGTVTVAAGATTATFTVATSAVSAQATATIGALLNGTSQGANLTINAASLSALALNPTSISGGNASTGTVTLTGAAGPGGVIVALTSSNASARIPATVTVQAGQASATFAITTSAVSSSVTATIQASLSGINQTATLTITPSTPTSLTFNPAAVVGSLSSTGTVMLSGPAPAGGLLVKLTNSSPAAIVPQTVTVPAGSTSATFKATTIVVGTQSVANVSATANGATVTGALTINPPNVLSLTLKPTSVKGGSASTGTVTIAVAAPKGGLTISLSSNVAQATVPTSVTIAAGKTTATITVKTVKVAKQTVATITASDPGSSKTASLTIN